jgi:UDP-N-acetylmuramoyl-tripeptide--D-alanyl-D-alanine ligase
MKLLYFLSTFWFFRQIKSILFWLYLWQLKEYHIGRFIDHFRTEKGKRNFLNKVFFLKIALLFLFVFVPPFRWMTLWLILFLYFLEFLKFLYDFSKKQILKPIFTSKIISLFSFSFLFTLFYLFAFFQNKEFLVFWLLVFDILSPAIFSGIVLIFQPVTFLLRSSIIQKAKKKREKIKDLLVIGICGSYGKTSTKEFLATILEEKFPGKVLKTKEHQNSEFGISKCILEDLKENHKIFIVEMGAYNKGGIKLLCNIAKPKIGIITGVNKQHLATFGSMENLISAEGGKELIESLPEDGLVIFNGENEILRKIYQETKKKKKIVGISKKEFDLWAGNIKVKKEVLFFQVFTKNGEIADFNLNLIGAQNIQNLLLAICCARELGMSLKEISRAAKKIRKEQSGVRLIKTKDGLNIVDTTYSANPDSVISHLEYLKVWPGKRIIVMPCLIELGPASKEIHKKIGKKIYEVCDLAIIVTKDRFKEIKEEAREKAIFTENPREIHEKIKQFNGENDIILLEGRLPKEFLNLVYGDQRNKR